MKYVILVDETVARSVFYTVEADSWGEAEEKALDGETLKEELHKEYGVIDRGISVDNFNENK